MNARRATVLVAIALVLALLAACASAPATTPAPAAPTQAAPATAKPSATAAAPAAATPAAVTSAPAPSAAPAANRITDKPITLTYFIEFDAKASATIKSYAEQSAYQELERITGIHIEFLHPPAGQANEKFNLMVSSGDLADILYRSWWGYPGGPDKAIDDGLIIDLKPLMEKDCPNYSAIFNKDPQIKKDITTDSGRMYYFTFFRLENWIRHTEGLMLRKDWLDGMGKKAPVTMDDWYDVLTAIKNTDCNGNGQKDEIPFIGTGWGALHRFIPAYGNLREFYLDKSGKIQYGVIQPGYKAHVAEMAKWYKEGLIDQDLASTDGTKFNAKVTGNIGGSFGGYLAGNMSTFMGLMQSQKDFQLVGSVWPQTKDIGVSYNPSGIAHRATEGAGAAISTKNKYPSETARWLDFDYSPEGHLLINFGKEGEAYDMKNGKPVLKDFILNDPKLSPVQMLSKYGQCPIWNAYIQDPDGFTQILKYPGVRETADVFANSDKSLVLPPLTPNFQEAQRINELMADIRTYVDENYTKWITGTQTLDNFDAYVSEIKKKNIDEVISIYEAAYARYQTRK